jgi:hypothetical protein
MKEPSGPLATGGAFKTVNCVDVWIDEPGDKTVRPVSPALLEHLKAERAKVYGSREPDPPGNKPAEGGA